MNSSDDAQMLLESLARLGCPCELDSVQEAPQTVRYALRPAAGVRMKSFRGIEPDLMIALSASSVRVECPVPGTATVGVELPRRDRAVVGLEDVIGAAEAPLRASIGVDVAGDPVVLDVGAAPHVLVAGRTGGGKSVLLHSILASLLTIHDPSTLEVILVDPKRNELSLWEDAPHVSAAVYDPGDAIDALWDMVASMETCYRVLQQYRARSLAELNAMLARDGEAPIPYRVLVCDETADLMMTGKGKVESAMVRLGQKGRAAGYHTILATQSPRVSVISGLLKANLPTRIALATSTALDSRIILDRSGAESLLGKGDGLLDDGVDGTLRRFQTAMVTSDEIASIIGRWTVTPTLEMTAA
jgi:S-DNA-T family DNA segregation ATPase FtsK/SpoIIIE